MAHPTKISQSAIRKHPLLNITSDEIRRASEIALRCIRAREKNSTLAIRFKNLSLHEPPKATLLPYLDAEAAGVPANARPFVPRCIEIVYSTENERNVFETKISLDSETEFGLDKAAYGQHSAIDR